MAWWLAHYGVTALSCLVRDPNRKSKVESGVGHAQKTPVKGKRFERWMKLYRSRGRALGEQAHPRPHHAGSGGHVRCREAALAAATAGALPQFPVRQVHGSYRPNPPIAWTKQLPWRTFGSFEGPFTEPERSVRDLDLGAVIQSDTPAQKRDGAAVSCGNDRQARGQVSDCRPSREAPGNFEEGPGNISAPRHQRATVLLTVEAEG